MRRLIWLDFLWLLVLLTGCRNPCDRVESALRARENDLREAREELHSTRGYAHALEAELRCARGDPGPHMPGDPPPLLTSPVKGLTLGRRTGGHDCGSGVGDDGLQVVLEPRDCEDQAVKVPAAALIQVQEISPEGIKNPLSTWQVPPDELRLSWKSGLLNTGYVVILPWKVYPSTEKLRVVAQLRLPDGRLFEAEKDVTVRLPPPGRRMPKVDVTIDPPTPMTPPGPMPGPMTLPPPRPEPKPGPKPDPDELPPPKSLEPTPVETTPEGPQLPPPSTESQAQPDPNYRPAASIERPRPL
jgi:hypothetical protein